MQSIKNASLTHILNFMSTLWSGIKAIATGF